MKTFKNIIERFTEEGKTISTMESCTGGAIVNALTNIEGAGDVLKYSAITYSNEFKIKMGVVEEIIEKYTVYSMETADAMAKAISQYANSNIGIGITGKLNRMDKYNLCGKDNVVYISVFNRDKNEWLHSMVEATLSSRQENKDRIVTEIIELIEKKVMV